MKKKKPRMCSKCKSDEVYNFHLHGLCSTCFTAVLNADKQRISSLEFRLGRIKELLQHYTIEITCTGVIICKNCGMSAPSYNELSHSRNCPVGQALKEGDKS